MAKLVRRSVIAIVSEATQNTPVSATATDYIEVEELSLTVSPELNERNYLRSTMDTVASVVGKRWAEVTFRTELKGSGVAGTAYTPLGAALKACSMTETDGASDVTYTPRSTNPANMQGPATSATIEVYMDGTKHVVAGSVGDVKLMAEVGKIPMLEFTFKGMYAEPTESSPLTPSYETTKAVPVLGMTISVMGTALVCSKFEIAWGNTIVERPSIAAATGIAGFIHSSKAPTGTVDPELDTVTAFNFWNKLITAVEASSSIAINGGAGNIVTITLPKSQLTAIPYGDRNGIRTVEASLKFNANTTGDDWISMVFT